MTPTGTKVAVDTSVSIPLLLAGHEQHDAVVVAVGNRELLLAGHAAIETFAVLTRLPVSERVTPHDAMTLMNDVFAGVCEVSTTTAAVVQRIASAGIGGGAVYDALVGMACVDNDLMLLTRDERALPTYAALGVRVELLS